MSNEPNDKYCDYTFNIIDEYNKVVTLSGIFRPYLFDFLQLCILKKFIYGLQVLMITFRVLKKLYFQILIQFNLIDDSYNINKSLDKIFNT